MTPEQLKMMLCKEFEQKKIEEICPICFENYENTPMCITECGHKFCGGCLSKLNICALCRKRINVQIEAKGPTGPPGVQGRVDFPGVQGNTGNRGLSGQPREQASDDDDISPRVYSYRIPYEHRIPSHTSSASYITEDSEEFIISKFLRYKESNYVYETNFSEQEINVLHRNGYHLPPKKTNSRCIIS